jgi:ketosteroid isomerase-like protein
LAFVDDPTWNPHLMRTPTYLAITVLLSLPGTAHALQSDTAALNRELQGLRDAFSRAYVEARFADIAGMYTADGVLLPSGGVVRGHADIQRFLTYGAGRRQVAHSMTPKSLTLHGNVAVETGVWSSTVQRGDAPPVTSSGRHMLVWERQADGRWLIAYDAWHQPPANRPEPQLVQDSVISAPGRNETWPSVDPVDGSLWFSVYDRDFDAQRLMRAASDSAGWRPAESVVFSTIQDGDRAPRFSADGRRLFFTSRRAAPGRAAGDLNVWMVERRGSGWSPPSLLPEPVNSSARDMHASVAPNGDVYLSSYRPGSRGRADLFRIPATASGYGPAEQLPDEINDERGQTDVLVSPDGTWLIVVVTDHPLGLGGDDLFLSRRTANGWTPLEHIPAPINSAEYEYGPSLSPDGRMLYFTSHRRGSADVYRLPIAGLGLDPVPGLR